MKRFLLVITAFFILSATSSAAHIKGGFFTYQYLGPGAGTNLRYQITLTVYMQCIPPPSPGQLNNPINFSIFNAATNQFIQNVSVPITNQYTLNKIIDEPCITGDERGCYYYIVVYDLPSIELASTPEGYIIAYQRCCRIGGINNIISSGAVGNTFIVKIPGTAVLPGAETNSSPTFLINDTAIVCRDSYFQYSFQATDPDGDSLSYSFCNAYLGADQNNSAPPTAASPPYISVPYQSPFSGTQPMGSGVTINATTGLITGIAPDLTGQFVICVCINEYRNGVLISNTRKELHVQVNDCNPLNAQLQPKFVTCDGFTVNFQNEASNPPGTDYLWTFGDPSSGPLDTSILPIPPPFNYRDTGIYFVKLKVTLPGGLCADSATMEVGVYPGFFPDFKYTGSCFQFPIFFKDTSITRYGVVDSWRWDFGDLTTLSDTSHLPNPQWTYSTPGIKTVTLTVTNSKGCLKTKQITFDVLPKPLITLAFKDALICIPDSITLNAGSNGNISWTPLTRIINANTSTPTVFPVIDTWYKVNLNDGGCVNEDSVLVRVVDHVDLIAYADTTICLTDPVQLKAESNGLKFQWTPAATLNDPAIPDPIAIPTDPLTFYRIRATIGSCIAEDVVKINTVPYPVANAGPPQVICYNSSAQLNGSHNGTSFSWSPTSYLDNPNILNPVATPPRTTSFVLTVFDNKGCPKPGNDVMVVTVNPKVKAFAGRDTVVVIGQPLLFNGSGGVSYLWSPSTGLNSTIIHNPVGTYGQNVDSVRYKLIVRDGAGCPDSAFVTVRVYKVLPTVFVPTAFTPNGDGLNDFVYPISVGIKQINYFSIYNRWGQLVFTTTEDRKGWDGKLGGRLQNTGVFVWMVSAIDYLRAPIFLKGTVTLIR